MRIILFGPPGSGKGTQGDLIEKKYGLPKISTGDLLRRAVLEKTALGRKAEEQMSRGKLVSDEIVEGLVRERIKESDCLAGYILDGFPRNLGQVKSLEAMDGSRPEMAIEIDLDVCTLVERMQSRLTCRNCGAIYNLSLQKPKIKGRCDVCGGQLFQRDDDRPAVISERMRVYREQTEKIRAHYQAKNVYHKVDGSGPVEEVFGRLSRLLDRRLAPPRLQRVGDDHL
jgi:adenylate kinase